MGRNRRVRHPAAIPTLLALLCLGFSGCQTTASGRAIDAGLGSRFDRLWRSSKSLLSGEVDRGRKLTRSLRETRLTSTRRVARLVTSSQDLAAATLGRVTSLPVALTRTGGQLYDTAARSLHRLTDGEREIYRWHRPSAMLVRFRDGVWRAADVLDLDRPILSAPGDPQRSTDPFHTQRRETFLERLLRRF